MGIPSDKIGPPSVMFERHIYNQYVIRADDRDSLRDFLASKGITTEIYYPLALHVQECMKNLPYSEGDFPVSEEASRHVLALPIYPELSQDQQEYVVKSVAEFYGL